MFTAISNNTLPNAPDVPAKNIGAKNNFYNKSNEHSFVFDKIVLNFYYQNVRGLRTKCSELYISSLACNYDIIAFSETWLHSSIYDSELFHSDFVVYRCDRTAQTSTFSRGGGVLISVRAIYSSEQIFVPSAEALEIVFVKVRMKVDIYLCCLYIPPSSDGFVYQQFSNAFNCFLSAIDYKLDDFVLICGDFNCTSVEWFKDSDNERILFPLNCNSVAIHDMLTSLFSYNLDQLNYSIMC